VTETLHLRVDPVRPEAATIARAAALLAAGALVAFPTETVYGLGADARREEAVARIFAAKGRPADNPLIVHVAAAAALDDLASELTPAARLLAARFWPGPLTLVVDAAAGIAPAVRAGGDTLAVRVPDHPVALALLRAFGGPVAAPSANRSGRPSPTRAADVLADLRGAVAAVLDAGPTAVGVESTVVDARALPLRVLREGGVTREALAAVLGPEALLPPGAAESGPVLSPGLRHRHYAPRCRVSLVAAEEWPAALAAAHAGGEPTGAVGRR
jgi:L-threonylcarbamoyladenylate synthase